SLLLESSDESCYCRGINKPVSPADKPSLKNRQYPMRNITDQKTAGQLMFKEVVEGMSRPAKILPTKYLYDQRGSELFDQICEVDEYYPTDTEISIMKKNIGEMTDLLGRGVRLIEFGSGSSFKTRLLLDHLEELSGYIPVEISGKFLRKAVRRLREEYPGLQIYPVVADYTQPFELPENGSGRKNVVYFPGSTIGNFRPEKAREFLRRIAVLTGSDGGLLIGVDLKKDRKILEAAYNDADGVTAAFNKNILVRFNRELNADFDIDRFAHRAFYNEAKGRIEMHLVSLTEQNIHIGNTTFHLKEGETLHTENSYKYTTEEFKKLASGIFDVTKIWVDDAEYFSVQYLTPVQTI
ncbi:MAG: L-histidine N(alpha)-methyltransferase, partial [Balneolaceae bacterium]